ncbi:saccharopine dehydrogenase family protein [Bacillus thermotolerans]|uniref:L-lysine dehydrogenase n=1 Tax=Bacillus thermotolerans TaxID=1221996 RepID=A0A0F5I1H4_BACTR|nr:saccharopine dehydrogenase C-terminal domain-containing protein [Bacillus thermotolerans]KKB39115.1 L-lysine dehydrogenase [Bacillus thermotolerans]KKB41598.1 L-lysine dehydrogenase [Bacillus thermotolerans]KKB42735.1 L-lysine dehydrogenase [Bacillus thermotolerans]
MRVLVLGSGLMGKEAARDLVKSKGVEKVTLADYDVKKAEAACHVLQSTKLTPMFVDASDDNQLIPLMKQHDVVINALFYSFNVRVAKAAIRAGVHSVDLGGHIGHATDRVLDMSEEAKAAGVTLIPDLGVAPGMINILSGYGAGKLDAADSIKLYVGGIPLRPDPPLEYNHVFSMEGLLDHYTDPCLIIRKGEKQVISALSEVENVHFEKFGPLEAFHTAGGTSTLSRSFPNLNCLEYKTIRYKGHAEKFKLLVDLQLTRADHSVNVKGIDVRPRDVLLKVLEPIVDLKDKEDVVLLRVKVEGIRAECRASCTYEMVTYKDTKNDVTAMARATANTISVVAQLLGSGVINKRGVYPPEQIVPGERYIQEMADRGVIIKEAFRWKS